jgi:CheY-like chemotaxis protein
VTKSGQRILVAEDEPMIRGLIIEILHGVGFEILEASSGSEALKLLGDSGSVDLVVTDLNMPGADGITVAKAARDRNPTVPVLFVGGREDMLESPRTPVPYAFLKKPFRLDELARMVRDMARHA